MRHCDMSCYKTIFEIVNLSQGEGSWFEDMCLCACEYRASGYCSFLPQPEDALVRLI